MNRLLRTFGLAVVAVMAVGLTGCFESDNVGKLEGTKWASAYVPEYKGVTGATATLRFTEDRRFHMEFRVANGSIRMSGRWRLGAGNVVYLDDVISPIGEESFMQYVDITGDVMTFEDPDGTRIVFTRVDEEQEKAARDAARSRAETSATGTDATRSEPTGQADRGTKLAHGS